MFAKILKFGTFPQIVSSIFTQTSEKCQNFLDWRNLKYVLSKYLLLQTALGKIFETKWRNHAKLHRTKKLWYLHKVNILQFVKGIPSSLKWYRKIIIYISLYYIFFRRSDFPKCYPGLQELKILVHVFSYS